MNATTPAYPNDPISPREAAKLLGVHISAVYRWLDHGRLLFWELPSGHRRVSRAEVLALPKPGKARKPVAFQAVDGQAVASLKQQTRETLGRFGLA